MGKEQLHEMINECEFVYIDNPSFFQTDDNTKPTDSHPIGSFPLTDTIFIEVPTIVAEETVYNCSDESDLWSPQNEYEDKKDPLYVPEYDSDEQKKSKVRKPLIRVKKLKTLLNEHKNECQKNNVTRKKNILNTTNSERNNLPPGENCEQKDLLWLLNFKLDGLIKNDVLDDFPHYATTQNIQNQRKDECEETTRSNKIEGKKPPFTYTELIESALDEKGPLTVSEIYQWISDTFPYYKSWDDRWKNSVRHNLSINPYFRKGGKAKQGSGHLWTVSKSAESSRPWSVKRQKYQQFEAYVKKMRLGEESKNEERSEDASQKAEMDDIREAQLAAASIAEDKENMDLPSPLQRDAILPILNRNHDLEQAVGEILSGVKRNVTVEYIDSTKSIDSSNNDFLNPVSKEVLMGECGFLNQIELNLSAESTDHLEIVDSGHVFDQLDDLEFQFSDPLASQATSQILSFVR